MALGGAQWVQGQVYAIDAESEAVLDGIEGLNADPGDEYLQREVLVQVSDQALPCLVYEIHPRCLVACQLIAHGNWLQGAERSAIDGLRHGYKFSSLL